MAPPPHSDSSPSSMPATAPVPNRDQCQVEEPEPDHAGGRDQPGAKRARQHTRRRTQPTFPDDRQHASADECHPRNQSERDPIGHMHTAGDRKVQVAWSERRHLPRQAAVCAKPIGLRQDGSASGAGYGRWSSLVREFGQDAPRFTGNLCQGNHRSSLGLGHRTGTDRGRHTLIDRANLHRPGRPGSVGHPTWAASRRMIR
jgi:hypothetical protein